MTDLSAFKVGQTVELQDGRVATVQYVGTTHFAAGDWIGVNLQTATGKNDGAVQGERYFDCQPGYGMFIRPTVARVIEEPAPKANGKIPSKPNGTALKTRPQSALIGGVAKKPLGNSGLDKRQSVSAVNPALRPRAPAAPGLSRVSNSNPL